MAFPRGLLNPLTPDCHANQTASGHAVGIRVRSRDENFLESKSKRELTALGRPGPLEPQGVELVLGIGIFGDDRLQEGIVTDRAVGPCYGAGHRNSYG